MFTLPFGETYQMDFNQIEMQCAAHFAASEQPSRDVHTEFAAKKFGVPAENITPAMRTAAKKLRPWKFPNWQQALDRIKRAEVYARIASKMFGVPEEDITPAMRKAAKNRVYGELYS